jgi:hypothetical protein
VGKVGRAAEGETRSDPDALKARVKLRGSAIHAFNFPKRRTLDFEIVVLRSYNPPTLPPVHAFLYILSNRATLTVNP